MTDDIATMFDDAADTLRNPSERMSIGPRTPSEAIDPMYKGCGVRVPLELYGHEFVTIIGSAKSHGGSTRLTAYLFDAEQDVMDSDEKLHSLDRLQMKTLSVSSIDSDDVSDDIAHLIATIMGYFTRYLLDGRNYAGWNPSHDEPIVTTDD